MKVSIQFVWYNPTVWKTLQSNLNQNGNNNIVFCIHCSLKAKSQIDVVLGSRACLHATGTTSILGELSLK